MAKNKKFAQGVNVGSSSILVTFVLLCLVTFAALAFVSAKTDYSLSKQTADRTTEFYTANHMAEVFLLNIESQIRMAIENCDSEEDFYNSVDRIFSDNNLVNVEKQDNGNIHISYVISVSDKQQLEIILCTSYSDFVANNCVSIEKWQTATTYIGDSPTLKDNNINLFTPGGN